jgi:ABC-2 type transport system ATP-binding protein
MANILEVRGLTKRYPKKTVNAAEDVTFDIAEGEVFAIIGPNGAGKTTTIRMIATLLQPTSGDAELGGFSLAKQPAKVRKLITYLPDEAGAYKTMTGIGYLEFMASLVADNPQEAATFVRRGEEICMLGDRLREKVGSYSRGMIRKLLLARAVMSHPKLAIMDEATSGLDVINALEIRRMIKDLAQKEHMSFLLSSHNMLEIEYLADRVALITEGKISTVGTVDELKARFGARNIEEVFEKAVENNATA